MKALPAELRRALLLGNEDHNLVEFKRIQQVVELAILLGFRKPHEELSEAVQRELGVIVNKDFHRLSDQTQTRQNKTRSRKLLSNNIIKLYQIYMCVMFILMFYIYYYYYWSILHRIKYNQKKQDTQKKELTFWQNFLQTGRISGDRVAENIITCFSGGVALKTSWTSRRMLTSLSTWSHSSMMKCLTCLYIYIYLYR